MYIKKRGASWTGCVDIGRDESGKRQQRWASGKTKKEVAKKLAVIKYQADTGTYIDEATITLQEYLTRWLQDYALHNVSIKTYASYKDAAKVLGAGLGGIVLCQLKPYHIQAFLTDKLNETSLSPTTVRYYYTVLNIALNTPIKWQLLTFNPCKGVSPPQKAEPQMAVLTREQANVLLDTVQYSEMYIPLLLALTCGLRRGEILGLTWDNVDLKNGTLSICQSLIMVDGEFFVRPPKTKAGRRIIALPEVTWAALRQKRKAGLRLEQTSNLVCCKDDWTFIRPDFITHKFAQIIKGIDGFPVIRFHDLRHTHATLLLQKGVHPKVVQERLGHSSISVTMDTYSHVMPSMQREAAEKINSIFA